jgi:ATP-dependent Clp protease protease subunit
LVSGRLDAGFAAEAAAGLMTLDAIGDEPIELHLDSPDGTLESAFVLIDTIDLLHATLRAHCHGQVLGPAIGVATAGSRNCR